MAEEQISNAALARKAAFLKEKEDKGGAEGVLKEYDNKPWRVFHDASGYIKALTRDEDYMHNDTELKITIFPKDQVDILLGDNKNLNDYWIKDNGQGGLTIDLIPQEFNWQLKDREFITQVTTDGPENAELNVKIEGDVLKVWVSDEVKKRFEGQYPISITVNNERLLRFYLTAQDDPYIMYNEEVISVAELVVEQVVERKQLMWCEHMSVFTKKAFESYKRV